MRRRWQVAIVALGVIGLALAGDFALLKYHEGAGPTAFTPQACAGTPTGQTPVDASVGLASWTTLLGSFNHNPDIAPGAAFNASWSFSTGGSVVMAPAVSGGVVYAGSMDGCLYAIDASSGHLIWSFAADNQVMSEPLVTGGQVFFGSGNKEMVVTPGGLRRGTGQSAIYALNAATGKMNWVYQTRGEDMPTPLISNGVVYAADGAQTFYAIDATSGKLLWKLDDGSYASMSSPVMVGNVAVFGGASPYAIIGVNTQTHKIAWKVPLPKASGGVDDISPAAAGSTVFVQVPEGNLFPRSVEMAIDGNTGQILWQRSLGTDYSNIVQEMIGSGYIGAHDGEEAGVATVSSGFLFVGSPGLAEMWALSAQSGQIIWHAHVPQPVRTAPVLVGNSLYATGDSRLIQLAATTGALIHSGVYNHFVEGSGIMIECSTSSPVVVGDTMFLAGGSNGSTVTAIPLGELP